MVERSPEPIDPGVEIGHVHLKVADLDDPDGNGLELYWDRPREEWPRSPAGELEMFVAPLDLEGLLAELDG